MDGFALSERWNGWSRLDTMVAAARAAIAAGPLDPLVCEVTIEGDEDTLTLDGLDELEALLAAGEEPLTTRGASRSPRRGPPARPSGRPPRRAAHRGQRGRA